MTLLYPKLDARPRDFQINPEWPLYRYAAFLGLGAQPETTRYVDSSAYRNTGTLTGYSGAGDTPADKWVYDGRLRRFVLGFDWINDFVLCGQAGLSVAAPLSCFAWASLNPSLHTICAHCASGSGGWGLQRTVAGTLGLILNGVTTRSSSLPIVGGQWTAVGFRAWGTDEGQAEFVANGVIEAFQYNPKATTTNICIGTARTGGYSICAGNVADCLLFSNRVLSTSEFSSLSDPTNTDLRIGGIPLILPPRRRWFPVAAAGEAPPAGGWKPYFATRRNHLIGA